MNAEEEDRLRNVHNQMNAEEEERLRKVDAHIGKCRRIKFGRNFWAIDMNPLVSAVAALLIWGFIIAIAVSPYHMYEAMDEAKKWVADVWSWIYILSQDIWVVVLLYVAFVPRYGNLKLGRDDEEPYFSDVTWLALIFTCGVAVGLFYFAAEPMWHFKGWGSPRFINKVNGYSHGTEDAVHGMMVTWYHWGIHGWIPYTTIGALLGLLTYRRGLPMSIRFGFYPLIGDRVYGWMGDTIDILSIVTTIMGVCTSLGMGAMSVNMGLSRLSQGFYRGVSHNVPDEAKYEWPTCDGTGNKYWGDIKTCEEKWTSRRILNSNRSHTAFNLTSPCS
jgi:choline-glycine betaine transporter